MKRAKRKSAWGPGARRRVPGRGAGGGAPGSSEVLDIGIQSDGPILRPFCNTLRPYINRKFTEIIVENYPKYQNKSIIHHFRINRSLAGWAHSQRRVGVNITIPLH